GIDFGSGNAFVSQHLLYSTQVGTAFDQVAGKRMAERVGTDFFLQSDFCRKVLDDNKYHDPGQRRAPAVQEYEVLEARFNLLVDAYFVQINMEIFGRLGANRYQAFFAAFAFDFDKLHVQKQVGNFQAYQFTHPEAAAIQNLQQGFVTHTFGGS